MKKTRKNKIPLEAISLSNLSHLVKDYASILEIVSFQLFYL